MQFLLKTHTHKVSNRTRQHLLASFLPCKLVNVQLKKNNHMLISFSNGAISVRMLLVASHIKCNYHNLCSKYLLYNKSEIEVIPGWVIEKVNGITVFSLPILRFFSWLLSSHMALTDNPTYRQEVIGLTL